MTQRRKRISFTRRQVAGAAGMVAVFLMADLLPSPAGIVPATPPVVQTRRALDFLGDAAVSWQNQFDCSGCHKQPLTVAALGAARASGYEAPRPGIVEALMVGGLSGSSGQGPDGCFSFNRNTSFTVATTLGGRGLEAYNLYFGADRSSELLAAAACLLGRQNADGRLASDRLELPVAQGDFITTGLGVFSWTRAFEVSGNVAYETARNQAVTWLRGQIGTMETGPTGFTTQDKSMQGARLSREIFRNRRWLRIAQLDEERSVLRPPAGASALQIAARQTRRMKNPQARVHPGSRRSRRVVGRFSR